MDWYHAKMWLRIVALSISLKRNQESRFLCEILYFWQWILKQNSRWEKKFLDQMQPICDSDIKKQVKSWVMLPVDSLPGHRSRECFLTLLGLDVSFWPPLPTLITVHCNYLLNGHHGVRGLYLVPLIRIKRLAKCLWAVLHTSLKVIQAPSGKPGRGLLSPSWQWEESQIGGTRWLSPLHPTPPDEG